MTKKITPVINLDHLATQLKSLGWKETAERFHQAVTELLAEKELNRCLKQHLLANVKVDVETMKELEKILQ